MEEYPSDDERRRRRSFAIRQTKTATAFTGKSAESVRRNK